MNEEEKRQCDCNDMNNDNDNNMNNDCVKREMIT